MICDKYLHVVNSQQIFFFVFPFSIQQCRDLECASKSKHSKRNVKSLNTSSRELFISFGRRRDVCGGFPRLPSSRRTSKIDFPSEKPFAESNLNHSLWSAYILTYNSGVRISCLHSPFNDAFLRTIISQKTNAFMRFYKILLPGRALESS